jgi:hypothetical protein
VLLGAAAAVLALLLAAPAAGAATIIVESDLDTNPAADGFCTLREAVFVANTNEPTGGRGLGNLGCEADAAGHDTIQLIGGHIYTITQGFSIEDGNVWADLDISGPTTIATAGTGMATIQGNGTDPQVNERDRVLHLLSTAGSVRLERVKVQGGWVNSGAVPSGGGILAEAPLAIVDSEITGNRVQVSNANTFGGGIYVRGPLGTLTMSGSTVAGNVGQVAGSSGQTVGGGLAIYEGAPSASITNSTISGNSAIGLAGIGPGLVGGAFFGDGGNQIPTTLTSNTITLNNASAGGAVTGGLQIVAGTMSGNIVAGNTADNSPQDCFGGPTASGGANIIGKSDGGPDCSLTASGDLMGTSATPVLANLGALVNNGGPTRTHLPNAGSPAINRGGSCPATDQRGLFRFNVPPCDSGSVEVGASATPPPPAPAAGPTGLRAAALKKCKKKKTKKKRKKCRKRAQSLPV